MLDPTTESLLPRVLEPEVMDDWSEAVAYDPMDFQEVDQDFARTAIGLAPPGAVLIRVDQAGLSCARVYQSSDRHWTVAVAAVFSSHIARQDG